MVAWRASCLPVRTAGVLLTTAVCVIGFLAGIYRIVENGFYGIGRGLDRLNSTHRIPPANCLYPYRGWYQPKDRSTISTGGSMGPATA